MGNTRRPAEVFPVGEFIRDELEERGWSQGDLAAVMDRPVKTVNELIGGKRRLDPVLADSLGAAFGTSPDFWIRLDAAFQLSQVDRSISAETAHRSKIYSKAPIKDMLKRGWIEPTDDVEMLERRLLRFLGIAELDEEPDILMAARKSTPYNTSHTPEQIAWGCRVLQIGRALPTRPFVPELLPDVVDRLRSLMHSPLEARHVPRTLNSAGIRFVVVEQLPKSKIDGACLWLADEPVIAMSLRFDRIDNFWFVLMHELQHVMQRSPSLDVDLATGETDSEAIPMEMEANKFAAEQLVPGEQIENFIARVRPVYSQGRIEAFARRAEIHPALVLGQLQHRGEVHYSKFRQLLEPIREHIVASAVTDGWGSTLSIDL